MAAGLYGQGAVHALPVQPQGLVDDILIPPLKAVVVPAQRLLNKQLQPVAGDGIRHHRTAGAVLQRNGRGQRHQPVAVDLPAVGIHRAAPVHVRVEDHAQVAAAGAHRLANAFHGIGVLRVGNMVGEAAVRLQIPAAGDIGPQRRQHLVGIKAAGAVARVHSDLKSLQGPLCFFHMYPPADDLPQVGGIGLHMVTGEHAAPGGFLRGFPLLCPGEDLFHIRGVQTALPGEELQPVAVPGVVAGGDLHGGGAGQVQHCHEHGGRGGQAAIVHRNAPGNKHILQGSGDPFAGKAGIVAQSDVRPGRRAAQVLFHPAQKAPGHAAHGIIRKAHRFTRIVFHGGTANIRAALQRFPVRIQHKNRSSFPWEKRRKPAAVLTFSGILYCKNGQK